MGEQKSHKNFKGSADIIMLLKTIPVHPTAYSPEEIRAAMNYSGNIVRLIYSLPTATLIYYDNHKYSYPSEDAKRKTLGMYGL